MSLLVAFLAKLLDPIFVGLALLVLMSFRSIWRYPLAILLATVVSETSLTLIQSSRVWGEGLVLSLLSGLLIIAMFVWCRFVIARLARGDDVIGVAKKKRRLAGFFVAGYLAVCSLVPVFVFVMGQDLPNRGADAYESEQPGYLVTLKDTAPNLNDPCLKFEIDEAHSDYAVIAVREHHDPAVDCPGDPGTAPLRAIYRVLKEDYTVLKMNYATGDYELIGPT